MKHFLFRKISFIFYVLFAALFAGCASVSSVENRTPFIFERGIGNDERAYVETIIKEINERNRTVEDNPEWIKKSYENFMIKNLTDLDDQDFSKYARYLDRGSVYIVVHPAYYTFFQKSDPYTSISGSFTEQNVMEKFLGESSFSARIKLLKAQEKMLMDFLEYASTSKKLVILVLPGDYRNYSAYKYAKGNDEYMRYINEVTNGSDSVLYFYSKEPNRGSPDTYEGRKLLKLLYTLKVKNILLGGGYIGRCLEDFYKYMEQSYSENKLYIVPEITTISPSDLGTDLAEDMLFPDGSLNVARLSNNIKFNNIGNQTIYPKLKNLFDTAVK